MSTQITTAFVNQFGDNVYHLVQQKGSKLRNAVRVESVTGKFAYFDQIGATAARKRTSRHSDTPRMDTPHSRRRVSLADYDWSDLIDHEDQVRMLIDPTSQYVEAASMAMGRSMDDVIIEAATATAYTGEDGSTATAYDTSMTVDVQTRWPGVTAADCGLNVAKLLEARKVLGSNNVDPDEEAFCIVNSAQIKSLLMDTRVSSHDYNAIKPLVDGQISRFGGFTMIPTERIENDANGDNKVLYWQGRGICLALGKDIMTRVSERDDKNYAKQAFACMTIGATRMEEERVGYIECDSTTGPEGNA